MEEEVPSRLDTVFDGFVGVELFGATEVDSTFALEEIVARLRAAAAQLTIGFHMRSSGHGILLRS